MYLQSKQNAFIRPTQDEKTIQMREYLFPTVPKHESVKKKNPSPQACKKIDMPIRLVILKTTLIQIIKN